MKLQHVAAATAVHEQGLNDDSGLKTTKEPPWQMSPLLLQEKPVLQLVPIPQFLQFLALPASATSLIWEALGGVMCGEAEDAHLLQLG